MADVGWLGWDWGRAVYMPATKDVVMKKTSAISSTLLLDLFLRSLYSILSFQTSRAIHYFATVKFLRIKRTQRSTHVMNLFRSALLFAAIICAAFTAPSAFAEDAGVAQPPARRKSLSSGRNFAPYGHYYQQSLHF